MSKTKMMGYFLMVLIMINSLLVYANGGPGEPTLYAGDGWLHFDSSDNMSLVSEDITIYVEGQDLNVDVVYDLTALKTLEKTDLYFILPEIEYYSGIVKHYEVWINDINVTEDTTYSSIPGFDNWEPQTVSEIVDPISGEVIEQDYKISNELYGIKIPIEVESNKITKMRITYSGRAGTLNEPVVKCLTQNGNFHMWIRMD